MWKSAMAWFTSRGSKMTEDNPNWERDLITKLAADALVEQRRRRRWGIFFKLLTFAYITFLLLIMVDWSSRADFTGGKKHTAMVELNGIIAPGTDASAEKITMSLQAAFKDKGTVGVILRINSPGGSPVQAQTIYDEMRRLRKKYPDVPLYAVVEDICASGGYFVAVGADRIYVAKSSIVGLIGVVREGRGKRLKETPDMFSGLIWSGEKSVELGLADGFGSLDSVARDVIKAEDIVDYTVKEGFAEKVAKRFGASAASALAELALRNYFTSPFR